MMDGTCCRPGHASPTEAIRAPCEKLLYTFAIYTGTGIQKPDYLATVDADPDGPAYSHVIHRLEMPGIGDELHHMGWNVCSSSHYDAGMARRSLLVPGVKTVKSIAMVGTSGDKIKFSYGVLRVLHENGNDMIPVNPNPKLTEIRGIPVFRSLGAIGCPVDMVEVFRPFWI